MKTKILTITLLSLVFFTSACVQESGTANSKTKQTSREDKVVTKKQAQVTFIELGSVNCIPCKKMQPVMRAVEESYGDQIEVIFYDVWQPDQKKYAYEYGINLIPTQIFLDKNGKELMRHEGFFPQEGIEQFLQRQGLKRLQEKS